MKYIAVVILLVLMSWTWCMATAERPMKLEQHKHVEAGIEEDIRAFIQSRYPNTTELFCSQLYTEVVHAGVDLTAHFRCQAEQGDASEDAFEQMFEGTLRIKSEDGFETWKATGGEIFAREVRFLNGIKITPSNKTPGEKSPVSTDEDKD